MTKSKILFIFIFLIILILFSACATSNNEKKNKEKNLSVETGLYTKDYNSEHNKKIEERIEDLLQKMTIEEKIGQLFIIAVRNNPDGSRMLKSNAHLERLIKNYKPGGIILFTVNFANPLQTRDLIRDAQKISSYPLFMAVDEEGGKVARLGNSKRMSVTLLPPASLIGETGDVKYAQMASQIISRELKALGFNMNMAPVADVNTNRSSKVIGNRTYSHDPLEAGRMVAAVTETMGKENIISVLKHFPGHGDTKADSHKGDVFLYHDKTRLENVEFIPFKMGIDAGADAVMTAHIKVPKVSGIELPSTLSPIMLNEILRNELNFKGIIISDAMDMGAIKNYWTSSEATIKAINAGVDVILMPTNIGESIKEILKAIREERISLQRIDDSVKRILRVKLYRGLFNDLIPGSENLNEVLGSEEHKLIIESIPQ